MYFFVQFLSRQLLLCNKNSIFDLEIDIQYLHYCYSTSFFSTVLSFSIFLIMLFCNLITLFYICYIVGKITFINLIIVNNFK
jgi:hypothetical protein